MARIRTIKPEFPQSESIGRLSREARLCFVLLWTLSDDAGRLRGNSRMLASLLYPYDDDAKELIDGWLAELEAERCVVRYQVEGETYLEICNWLKHQKIDKPSQSKIPAIPGAFAKPREDSKKNAADQGRDQGRDQGGAKKLAQGFALFWDAYPKRISKGQAEKAWLKLSPDERLTAEILQAVESAKTRADWQKQDGQFIPYPATWLNARGWEDAPSVTLPKPALQVAV